MKRGFYTISTQMNIKEKIYYGYRFLQRCTSYILAVEEIVWELATRHQMLHDLMVLHCRMKAVQGQGRGRGGFAPLVSSVSGASPVAMATHSGGAFDAASRC